MSGYGYDFLQMIAPYAGFEYEYVGYDKSWSEMQQMLENGKIDLLTSAHVTPERLERFDFSNHAIGYNSTILTTLSTNPNYTTGDYSTFNGMNVGLITNNTCNESFRHYAEKNGFSYVPVYFNSQEAMTDALSMGSIDAIVTSDLRVIGNELILDKFDEERFYAIAQKGNSEILERLTVLAGFADLNKGFNKLYGNSETLEYPTTRDCVQAVLDKKADAAYAYVYTALKYVCEDSTGFLIYTPIAGISTNFSMGINKNCAPCLYSVMNRITSNIGEDDIQAAISKNTRFATTNNPILYFIYHNPVAFALLIASVIAAVLFLIILKINRDRAKGDPAAKRKGKLCPFLKRCL